MNKTAVGVLSVVLSTGVFAGGMQDEPDSCWGNAGACQGTPLPEPMTWRRVTALSLAPAWTSNGETQTFYLKPRIQKTYYAADEQSVLFDGELFYGTQHAINTMFIGQFGVALAVASNANLRGTIWEDANSQYSNYEYKYNINHAHLALKGKLLAEMGLVAQPYVSGSLGVGANQSHGFTITPIIYQEVPAPEFKDHTVMAFSYTLGFGAQTDLNEHWQIGIGYELTSWGNSQLAAAQGQQLHTGLELSNLYTNALQITLSYVA